MITPSGSSAASVDLFSAPVSGIQEGLHQLAAAAGRIAAGDLSVENAVARIEAKAMVKANVASLRTADEMVGMLLNTVA